MPKAKITRFPPWQTKNDTGIEKRYIRIGVTMTSSEVFRNLSSSAVRVYINMMMESGGNKNFKFPYNKYSSYMTKPMQHYY